MSMGFEPTNEQLAIIQHPDEPLRVAAGAGTGKTTTIVERIAHLVDRGLDPSRILGVTFTNKAADELNQRVLDSIGADLDGRVPEISTYHGFAASVLDEFGEPDNRFGPVGEPPITEWVYGSFRVYFEDQTVLHSIDLNTIIMPKQ